MTPTNSPYPKNFNFVIEMDGQPQASFTEISGLSAESNAIDYREGGGKPGLDRLPGVRKTQNITLRRGVIATQGFCEWLETCSCGPLEPARLNLVIARLGPDRKALPVRWRLAGAMPLKWAGPVLSAKGGDVAIEELVLTVEGVTPA